MLNKITSFRGDYSFLSNFYPCEVKMYGIAFDSAEAAYQAQKCKYNEDRLKFKNISAREAKQLGKEIEINPVWKDIRIMAMQEVVFNKFHQNPDLKHRLIATGTHELIEGNSWGDTFWGVCQGEGENMLGKILMQVRKDVR